MEIFLCGDLSVWRSFCVEIFLCGDLSVWRSFCVGKLLNFDHNSENCPLMIVFNWLLHWQS